jgi:hypothetical protein
VAVAAGGVLSIILVCWATVRVIYFDAYRIDALSANLLTLASFAAIPSLVFGVWMCWRRIGFAVLRYAAVAFGIIGLSAWPLMDYVSR